MIFLHEYTVYLLHESGGFICWSPLNPQIPSANKPVHSFRKITILRVYSPIHKAKGLWLHGFDWYYSTGVVRDREWQERQSSFPVSHKVGNIVNFVLDLNVFKFNIKLFTVANLLEFRYIFFIYIFLDIYRKFMKVMAFKLVTQSWQYCQLCLIAWA